MKIITADDWKWDVPFDKEKPILFPKDCKYELEPVCWSAYIDMGIRSDRDLTEEEIIQFTVNDLIYAKKAGFPLVRTQHAISPKIFRQMIPFCKELGVKLTIEMHHPHHPEVPVWKEYFEIMKGEGKGWLGFVPDFSIFQTMPHKLYLDQAISFGAVEGHHRLRLLYARQVLLSGQRRPRPLHPL